MTSEELLYAKTHEWVHVETDASDAKLVTVGLSDHAIKLLTDLVYLDLPEVGSQVEAQEPFGEIESVKAVSDLCSPVRGEVVEVNAEIADDLETLGDDPYGAGWLVKIKVTDPAGLSQLMDHATYKKECDD